MKRTGRLLGAAAALALLVSCGTSGGASDGGEAKVIVALVPGISANVPIKIGIEQGIFARNGVNVELIQMPTGVTSSQVLFSGTANYSTTLTSSIAQAFQQGQRVSYGCGIQLVNPVSIVAPKGSGLPSTANGADWNQIARSMEGGTIGVPVPVGTTLQYARDDAMRQAGVDPKTLTYVNTGGGASLLGALTGKSVTVADAQTPSTEALTVGPNAPAEELIYLPEDGPETYRDYGTGFVADRAWLEKNPETAAKFCKGVADVVTWLKDPANTAAFGKAVVDVGGELEPAALDRAVARLREIFSADIPREPVEAALRRAFTFPGVLKPEPVPTFDDIVLIAKPQ